MTSHSVMAKQHLANPRMHTSLKCGQLGTNQMADLSRLWANGTLLSPDADSTSGNIHHVLISGSDVPAFGNSAK